MTDTRSNPPLKPKDNVQVNLQVSIPCKVSGYTGQRGNLEAYVRQHVVTVDGGNITLTAQDSEKRQITFARADLDAALGALGDHNNVMR